MFSSRGFYNFGNIFKWVTHFELIFVCDVKQE